MSIKGQDDGGNFQGACSDMDVLNGDDLALPVQVPGNLHRAFPNGRCARNHEHFIPDRLIALKDSRRANSSSHLSHDHSTCGNRSAGGHDFKFQKRVPFFPCELDVPGGFDQNGPTQDFDVLYGDFGSATCFSLGKWSVIEAGSNICGSSSAGTPDPCLRISWSRCLRSISSKAWWIASVFVFAPRWCTTRSNKSPSMFNVSLMHIVYVLNTYDTRKSR